jgi:hypothetical protein
MRQMTSPLRRWLPGAVREAWTAAGLRRTVVVTAGVAAAVGAFLAFVGAFGLTAYPLVLRIAYMVPVSILTSMIGLGGYLLAGRLAPRLDPWLRSVLGGLLIFAPIGVIVWLTAGLFPGANIGPSALPGFIGTSLVVSVAMSLLSVAVNLARQDRTQPALDAGPSRFLERLPVRMRSAEIWAIEAEDHYLRVHTSLGETMVLMRLADAVRELASLEGLQTHRSWWVARQGLADASRGDGKVTLTLKSGGEAPVSRTYLKAVKDAGWL